MKVSKTYNLKILFPQIVEEWDYVRNEIDPENVAPKSGLKVWWICKNNHSWLATIKDRHKYNCPYCAGQKATKDNNLLKINPSFLKEWDYSKNQSPENYCPKSNKKVWWKCKNNHSWKATICSRYNRSCPYCSGHFSTKDNNLLKTNPSFLKEWNYDKNQSPENYCPRSNKKVWWICKNNHIWRASIKSRYVAGCPYCSGRLATEENNLTLNVELMKEWSSRNTIDPKNITQGSQRKVWWKCKNGHEWKAFVNNRSRGASCPYCSRKKPNKEYNLQTEKPEIARLWHPKNKQTPQDVLPSSNKKVWWICNCGREYVKRIVDCTVRCSKCSKKISQASTEWLNTLNIVKREVKIKIKKRLFYVDGFENDIIYEFLGSFWHGDPRIYKPKDKNYFNKKEFGKLLYETIERLNVLCKHYKIIYCWESEKRHKEYVYLDKTEKEIMDFAELVYKSNLDILQVLRKET